MMNESTILVTGGAGFIGSSLCDDLLSAEYTVICIDNFDDYYSPETKNSNIMHLSDNNQFYLEEGDIRDYKFLENVFTKYPIDMVIHLASKAGVRASIANVEAYFEVNVRGSITLFEVMKAFKVSNLIFASSSSVYGNNNKIQKEADCCDYQESPYAITKKTVELMTYNYHTNFGFNVLNLRLFSVYGPKQRPDLFIYKIFKAIYENSEIEIYGDGEQQRDYTHINDVLAAFHKAINLIQAKGSIYEIINIGNSKPISVNSLISMIERTVNKKVNYKYIQEKKGDVISTYADVSKAEKILQFCPKKKLEEGIKEFNVWYEIKTNGTTIKTNYSN